MVKWSVDVWVRLSFVFYVLANLRVAIQLYDVECDVQVLLNNSLVSTCIQNPSLSVSWLSGATSPRHGRTLEQDQDHMSTSPRLLRPDSTQEQYIALYVAS